MEYPIGGHEVGKALMDAGLVPDECADIEILLPADGLFQIRYTINVKPEDIPKILQAFAALATRES